MKPKQDKDRIEFNNWKEKFKDEFCEYDRETIVGYEEAWRIISFIEEEVINNLYNWHIQKQLELLEEIKKEIGENRKGTFTDDGGNDCWYIDDLQKHLDSKILSIKEQLK